MREAQAPLAALGALLAYPDGTFGERLAACARELAAVPLEVSSAFESFRSLVADKDVRELEELYTRTFDMNPACSLEVGWHLFGEQYERGAFLVRMRQEMRRFALAEDHELPDHMVHALSVASRMEAGEARRFESESIAPAVRKILEGMAEESNPYRHLMKAISALLPPSADPSAVAADGPGSRDRRTA